MAGDYLKVTNSHRSGDLRQKIDYLNSTPFGGVALFAFPPVLFYGHRDYQYFNPIILSPFGL